MIVIYVEKLLDQLAASLSKGEIGKDDYRFLQFRILQTLGDLDLVLPRWSKRYKHPEHKDMLGNVFCLVPSDVFIFGTGDTESSSETRAPYYIAKYPVTVKEFETFVSESGHEYPADKIAETRTISPDDNCPAVNVSWEDAKAYCRWLRKKTNEYYSLPMEAEWEQAARGIDGRPNPWGLEEPNSQVACYDTGDTPPATVPVDTLTANISPYGCVGMVGNVWEWCLDSIDAPEDPHIMRGGAWCNSVEFVHCTSRATSSPPGRRVNYAGFRVMYLPGEMLTDYKKNYRDGAATQAPQPGAPIQSSSPEPVPPLQPAVLPPEPLPVTEPIVAEPAAAEPPQIRQSDILPVVADAAAERNESVANAPLLSERLVIPVPDAPTYLLDEDNDSEASPSGIMPGTLPAMDELDGHATIIHTPGALKGKLSLRGMSDKPVKDKKDQPNTKSWKFGGGMDADDWRG